MVEFSQEEFNRFVLEEGVLGFFDQPVVLKSNRESNWYVNWRGPTGDAFKTNRLAEFVLSFTRDKRLRPDCFYGVPEGATKLALATQLKLASQSPNYDSGSHILPMGRGKPKEHGRPEDRYFLQAPRGGVIIIEDVTTTGDSLLSTIDQVLELGDATVLAAIGLTNRCERRDDRLSVAEAVNQKNIPYFELSRGPELLKAAYRQLNPGEAIGRAVEAEFTKYGVEPLQLVD